MEYILWFDQLDKNSGHLAGGKAANIGEMVSLRLPVPQGFVVTTKAFDLFLEKNQIKGPINEIISRVNVDNTQQLLQASKDIKKLITSTDYLPEIKSEITRAYNELSVSRDIKVPEILPLISAGREYAIVAVRSSATTEDLPTASFAGQQMTYLNVKGVTDLLDKVRQCWASLYEPRAIFYRAKQGFKHSSIAVIVQRMINADKAGVIFTVNPTTGEEQVVIEATWGLGESLVLGEIEPDRYIVSNDGSILEKKIGTKKVMRVRDIASDRTIELRVPRDKIEAQVLTEGEVIRLTKYAIGIEDHYKKPQDIEFAIEKGKIFILQTRAITTEAKVEEEKITGEPILKGLGVSPGMASGIVRIVHGLEDIDKIEKEDILVTTMTSPDLVPTMSKCSAIITDAGGTTCHAAIVSREMGIPAIVGTQTATKALQDGQEITVDAYRGLIYPGKIEIAVEEKPKVTVEKIPTKIEVKVNLAFPEFPDYVPKLADGVGLLRIEHMIIKSGKHPAKLVKEGRAEEYTKILLDGIRSIAKAFHPKPVWVRSLDARSDELRNLEGGEEEEQEANPMLGWHGIRRSLDEPEILKAEFTAVKKLWEEGLDNVHVMLPFIISAEEYAKARRIASELLPENCKLGIMVETPGAAVAIKSFCKEGIDFASIGSNDLTQAVLCIDRNNEKISRLFDEGHPAVLRLMKHVVKICNKYNIESSICGEAASNRGDVVRYLLRCGIKSISVNIDALEHMKQTVKRLEEIESKT